MKFGFFDVFHLMFGDGFRSREEKAEYDQKQWEAWRLANPPVAHTPCVNSWEDYQPRRKSYYDGNLQSGDMIYDHPSIIGAHTVGGLRDKLAEDTSWM